MRACPFLFSSLRRMRKKNLSRAWKWFNIISLSYILVGIILYFIQDRLIFHPKPLPADYRYQFDIPFTQIDFTVSASKNLSIVQFTVPDSVRKGIVLYFHGNRTNINRYAKYAPLFTQHGYEVWMMDYPGYGKSTGKRTEQALYDDALVLHRFAIKKVSAEHIVLYGKSLGTGIASQLASVRDCRRLILETPYYSMDALAKHYFFIYPVMPLSKFSLPTFQYFKYINAPITIFHGTRDAIIPYDQAKRLKEKKEGTELIRIKGGHHNDLTVFPSYRDRLGILLQ
jgi:alpha-beta hydrolase superfamily lysophospholipase